MTNSLVTLEMILEELRKKIKSRERTDGDEIKKGTFLRKYLFSNFWLPELGSNQRPAD